MERVLKKMAVLMAVAVVVAFGAQACSDEEVAALLLGLQPGPSAEQLASQVNNLCGDVGDCDGDIEPVMVMVSGEKYLPGYDDDYEALMLALTVLGPWNNWQDDIWDEFYSALDARFPEGIPEDQEVTHGPFTGVVELNRACGSGTGQLAVTLTGTFVGLAGKGLSGGPVDQVDFHERYNLTLNSCVIEGDLTGDMTTQEVTLTGNMIMEYDWIDGVSEAQTITGGFTINPGAVEPAGGPVVIWGYNEPLSIDISSETDLSLGSGIGFDTEEGGICYGGTVATAMDCDDAGEIFMDAGAYYDLLFDWDDD